MIKRIFILFAMICLFLSLATFAQAPKSTPKAGKNTSTKAKPKNAKAVKPVVDENEEFEKANAQTDLAEKVKSLQKFLEDFPNTAKKNEALEIIFSIRSIWANEKFQTGEVDEGIKLFKEALNETPSEISDGLFTNAIMPFPNKLFYLGKQTESLQIANLVESRIGNNPKLILGLASFYLGIEKGNEARMLAEKASELDENMPAVYQILGMAYRINFDLEGSEKAYSKALEVDPKSSVSKRSLAEIKRAVGKPEEAVTLYRELLEADANDATAQNGLVLSLFDAGYQREAEDLLSKELEKNPKNLILLVGAAYWYAAHDKGAKAVELGEKAVEVEPRYVWGRIALARGFMLQNQPFEAEKVLLLAQKNGSFPTLDYELATARFQAGLYEEAVRELKKRFAYNDNYIQTYIAGRSAKEAQSFTELLGLERRASIFTPDSVDKTEEAEKLKALLHLNQILGNKESTDEEINKTTDDFIKGDDKMKSHRQLYAASRLMEARRSLPKVLELTQNAVKGLDSSLDVENPAAPVLADELIESRSLAIIKDEVIVIPDVPKQTLSKILRGKIEEIAGWTLYQQDKPKEAVVRLKRAVSILPENSAWWRSSNWRLGLALDTAGNSKEALEPLIKSYLDGQPDRFRRMTIEGVYRKVNGNTDGLEKLIGENPFPETVAQNIQTPEPSPTPEATPSPTPAVENTPEEKVEPTPNPENIPVEPTPTPVESTPTPTPESIPKVEPKTENTPEPTPEVKTTPIPVEIEETKEEKKEEVKIEPTPTPEVKPNENVVAKNEVAKTQKSLFDPVVIEIGKKSSKPAPTEEKITPTEKEVTSKKEEIIEEKPQNTEETPKVEETKKEENSETTGETVKEKETEEKIENPRDPIGRARVVVSNTFSGQSCVVLSQESVSILSNGGNLGVLVGLSQEGDITKVAAESSSPKDVSVTLEPDIGRQSKRAFYLIKSISENKGTYNIVFTSPCGKKELPVKVR